MEKIKTMSIDLETYSDVDIRKAGVYRYSQSDAFEILLFGVSINGGPITVYDIASGDPLPENVLAALSDEDVTKWAFNASFERICISNWLRKNSPDHFKGYGDAEDTTHDYLSPASWRCSLVWSAYMGLPLSLDGVGAVLKLQDQKMKEGKDLIRYFCTPCKPTKTNGGRTRNYPYHDESKWESFKEYNKRDVEVEMAIQEKLARFPVPDFIWEEYHISEMINDRGIQVDMQLVENAIDFDVLSRQSITERLRELTGLLNPGSVLQMRDWLQERGIETDSLDKKAVSDLLKDVPADVAEVLQLRQGIAKSSVKKYKAMQNAVCKDNRARGMFFFYGANRTGRFAGRLIQLQNLRRNDMPDLAAARDTVKYGDYYTMSTIYDDVPDTLSQLVRTAFIPKPGYKLYVADFSAIEARVLSFLAYEQWRLDVFNTGGDIYCASASQMFGVPVEKHGVNGHLRQKGKIAELALGYGGSTGALTAMGATDMGIPQEDLQPLVDAWRAANPNIVSLWWDIDRIAKKVIKERTSCKILNMEISYKSGMMFITLPSGRSLTYVKPAIGENRFGGESITYEGIGPARKWCRLETYGPKLVENIVQAVSRDLLVEAMRNLKGMYICGHIHDELILECKEDVSLVEVCQQMARVPDWLSGIKLRADGYTADFYMKD